MSSTTSHEHFQYKLAVASLGYRCQQLISKGLDLHMLEEVSGLRQIDDFLWRLYRKYDPNQPRVPAGQTGGGQWTDGSGGGGMGKTPSAGGAGRIATHPLKEPPDEPALESWYPVEEAILTALPAGRAVGTWRAARAARAAEAARVRLTDHGAVRVSQRGIMNDEIHEAVRTAQESGNVTTKTGKYGTLQKVYKGSNGTTVIIETSGRNAGKVITLYRH